MAEQNNVVFCLVCLALIVGWFASGLYIFTCGFLLTRREINLKSTCKNTTADERFSSTCWTVPAVHKAYAKVVFIVIDALRYDFSFYQVNHSNSSNTVAYINKLKIFKELANDYGCESVRLFRFRADAPTTTMQRLKGMTTGSFPTFIDVGKNFDSSEISEDNLIDQLIRGAKENITFLGDDTWVKLFPGRFATAYTFPSFDVKDLHLVDNGIVEHLVPELQKNNWKMLIAHFLGVDHCGHRYGPMHEEMSAKLIQMDHVLRSVVETLDEDTLLLVMGDHGMTQTGDHGGETQEEIDSALFAFIKSGKFSKTDLLQSENCAAGLVHQIDLVPTLSLLLGNPIPFSNLGAVIPDFIPSKPITALRDSVIANAKQIETYLLEYSARYNKFDSVEFLQIMDSLKRLQQMDKNPIKILEVLHTVRKLCKSFWADFDEKLMILGSCLFSTICFVLFYQNFYGLLFTVVCFVFYLFSTKYEYLLFFLPILALFCQIIYSFAMRHMLFVGCFCIFFPLFYASNSFVMNEDAMTLYLYTSTVFMFAINVLKQTYSGTVFVQMKKKKSRRLFSKLKQLLVNLRKPLPMFIMYVLAFALPIRISFLFRVCRSEQFWCQNNLDQTNTQKINGLSYFDFSDSWTRLFVSGGSVVVLFILLSQLMKREGNMRCPYSAAYICSTRLLPFALLCIIVNWQLHTLSVEVLDSLPSYLTTFLPRCAYFLLALSILWWLIKPLNVHLLYHDKFGRLRDRSSITDDETISFFFNQLKYQWNVSTSISQRRNDGSAGDDKSQLTIGLGAPIAFGLYTLVSSALIGFGTVLILFGAMLLEEEFALVLLLFVISTWSLLEIISAFHYRNKDYFYASWNIVGIWVLSSSFWWFATGHQASLSSIPWNAAFVGFRGSHSTVFLPALMVGSNIFISQILHTVFLPLLILWPIRRGTWFSPSQNLPDNSANNDLSSSDSEYNFMNSPNFWSCLFDLFCKHIALQSLKVLGCIIAAFVHRRHLMVWQIFAPRFVYEVLSFLVVCGTTLIMFGFIFLFKRSVNSWIKRENANITFNKIVT